MYPFLHSIFRPLYLFFFPPFLAFKEFFKSLFQRRLHERGQGKDLALFENKDMGIKCVGCKLCEVACPSQAIIIDTMSDKNSRAYPSRFDVDMTKCITCGVCEQACPVDAIGLVSRTMMSIDEKEKLYHTKETLLENGRWAKDSNIYDFL